MKPAGRGAGARAARASAAGSRAPDGPSPGSPPRPPLGPRPSSRLSLTRQGPGRPPRVSAPLPQRRSTPPSGRGRAGRGAASAEWKGPAPVPRPLSPATRPLSPIPGTPPRPAEQAKFGSLLVSNLCLLTSPLTPKTEGMWKGQVSLNALLHCVQTECLLGLAGSYSSRSPKNSVQEMVEKDGRKRRVIGISCQNIKTGKD